MYRSLAILIILLSSLSSIAQTEPKQGWYVRLAVPNLMVGGDFDGDRVLISTNASELFTVPKIDPAFGWSLSIGQRVEKMAIEFSYARLVHSGSWVGFEESVTQSAWNLDFKYFFRHQKRLQPFIQFGWNPGSPTLRVENGAFDATKNTLSDAIFISNIGNFNVGSGITWYITPRFSICGTALYRRLKINAVKSEAEKIALVIEGKMNADSFGYVFSAAFTF